MKREITGKQGELATTLPASGLSEDILGAAMSSSATGGEVVNPIYAFADRLTSEQVRDTKMTREQIETWVTFSLGGEDFGLPVTHVQEILRVTGITRVPHAPPAVRGVTNMRGRVLPVVDLRARLGLETRETDLHSRVLVVSSHGRLLGLLVDSVQQVLRLDRTRVEPPPPDVMTQQSDYILGVYHLDESLVILLDVDRALVMNEVVHTSAPSAL
jgi:purine-binding chemotaxis protein CheW